MLTIQIAIWTLRRGYSRFKNVRPCPGVMISRRLLLLLLLLFLLLIFSPWAGLGRDQSSVRGLVWLWYAATWASS